MGALSDFMRGAAGEVYNQRQQKRYMEEQEAAEERRTQRQLKYAEAAEARRRLAQNQDRATELNMQGPQVGLDDQGRPSLLRAIAEVDPNSGALTARRERVADAPRVPTKEVERKVGDKIVRYRQFSDGTEEVIAEAPRYRPDGGGSRQEVGEDGLTAYQRAQLEERRKNRERLERNGGKGGERPDNVRKAWDDEAVRIGEMEGEALRSKATQYGMDQRGLPTDDETLRSALLAQVDAEYGKRLESARSRGGRREEPKQETKRGDNPPVDGAKKAPDGNWYVQRNGKWFKVESD